MTTLIRIGNSQGVRIPKAIIEQAQLAEKKLSFEVTEAGLLIKPVIKHPRTGWETAFAHAEHDTVDSEWLETPLTQSAEYWEW